MNSFKTPGIGIRRFLLIATALLVISVLRAGSALHYTTWHMDEHFIVPFAVGFLDYDLDPHWFVYHTLPMYIIAGMYAVLYFFYELAGLVHSKAEFASLLFEHDAIFYISARLLVSLVHTLGVFVLATIVQRYHRSTLGALLVFGVGILIPDSALASNDIRVDGFVFLFLCLLILFSCYGAKTRRNFVFSLIACAAAIASKLPALVLFPVLLLALVIDVRHGHYTKLHIAYAVVGVPLLTVVFMPYAVLDFETYKEQVLHPVFKQATGASLQKIIKTYHQGTWSKLDSLYNLITKQVGVGTVVGVALAGISALARRDWRLLLVLLYTLAYTTAFATSSYVESYWLRPVYPLYLFLMVTFVVDFSRNERYAALFRNLYQHFRIAGRAIRLGTAAPLLILAVYFAFLARPGVLTYAKDLMDTRTDTRALASLWIQENLPKDSIVILDNYISSYLPKVFSPDPRTTFRSFGYPHAGSNELLVDGFNHFFRNQIKTAKWFHVTYLDARKWNFDLQTIKIPSGAYIVISSSNYSRYYLQAARQNDPVLTRRARKYYDTIRHFERIHVLTGKGPKIEIYRVPLHR